jgi:hypothetical protein
VVLFFLILCHPFFHSFNALSLRLYLTHFSPHSLNFRDHTFIYKPSVLKTIPPSSRPVNNDNNHKKMAALKLFNILALASVALLALQSGPTSVNALTTNRAHVARYVAGHEAVAVAKRKRDTSSGTCKPKPTASASMSSSSYGDSSASLTSTYGDSGTPTSYWSSSTAVAVPYTPAPSSSSTSTYSATPTPASTPASSGSSNGKKWGLAWPNGDTSYLSTFAARPNVGLCVFETLLLFCLIIAQPLHLEPLLAQRPLRPPRYPHAMGL